MILKQIRYLFSFLFAFLLGVQTTYAKTELVLPQIEVSFSIRQTQSFQSLEKEVPPNIGFLKEKSKFGKSTGSSTRINWNLSKWSVEYLAEAGSKVNLLGKIDNLTSLKTWVNGLDDVADANLITKLDGLDVTDLPKLEADIASNSMGPGLKALLKESPDDLNDMWKLLKDDPKYAFELSKEGGSRWEKWAQGNFFKTVTKAGKDFEIFVSGNLSVLRTKLLSKYSNIDLNDYAIFEQIQIKTGQKLASGSDEFFVADFVLVKKKTVLGQEILDFDNAIVLETKLSSGTALTTPQANALTKAKTTSNTFNVRTISKESKTSSDYVLGSGTSNKTLTVTDYIKVNSNGIGGTIQDVNSLK